MARPYTPRPISHSLARSQRIIQLSNIIRSKYAYNDDKSLIDERAEKVRSIHSLENRMRATKTFADFNSYKAVLKSAKDGLEQFDKAVEASKVFEPTIVKIEAA